MMILMMRMMMMMRLIMILIVDDNIDDDDDDIDDLRLQKKLRKIKEIAPEVLRTVMTGDGDSDDEDCITLDSDDEGVDFTDPTWMEQFLTDDDRQRSQIVLVRCCVSLRTFLLDTRYLSLLLFPRLFIFSFTDHILLSTEMSSPT